MAKTVTFSIQGIAPYSFSKPIVTQRGTGETPDKFEQRTWRERIHVNEGGQAFIPPMAIKLCLTDCAKFLSETIPGKGKNTFTKHFKAGLIVTDGLLLETHDGRPILAKDIVGENLFRPANGRAGDGSRVWRTYPVVPEWQTHGEIHLIDPVLMDKAEKIQEYLEHAGNLIGLGRFRPINNGFYGRFKVTEFSG